MKYVFFAFFWISVIAPFLTYAATPPADFKGVVGIIVGLIEILIYIIFALTFLVVAWGILKTWIFNGGESKGVEDGKKILTAGIIGLVVMSSLWGIVYLVKASFFGG